MLIETTISQHDVFLWVCSCYFLLKVVLYSRTDEDKQFFLYITLEYQMLSLIEIESVIVLLSTKSYHRYITMCESTQQGEIKMSPLIPCTRRLTWTILPSHE